MATMTPAERAAVATELRAIIDRAFTLLLRVTVERAERHRPERPR